MKFIAYLFLVLPLHIGFTSCSSKKQQDKNFCECLKVSAQFNELSSKFVNLKVEKADSVKMNELGMRKLKVCEDFKYLDRESLLEKTEACRD